MLERKQDHELEKAGYMSERKMDRLVKDMIKRGNQH